MSSRILTSHFSGLEEFLQQHAALLAKSTDGTVAVFANNALGILCADASAAGATAGAGSQAGAPRQRHRA